MQLLAAGADGESGPPAQAPPLPSLLSFGRGGQAGLQEETEVESEMKEEEGEEGTEFLLVEESGQCSLVTVSLALPALLSLHSEEVKSVCKI